jgi:hypothetical protein
MNLQENINRIKEVMGGINESVFLRRRIPTKLLDDSFNESLSYWITNVKETMRRQNLDKLPPPVFANMIHAVISMTIDEIHPELFSDREDFPYKLYDEIFQSLTNRYFNQMEQAYNEHFPTLITPPPK